MNAPLDGIRVIDLTAMVSGPLATQLLADQGAQVIKIEKPGSGDYTRLAPNQQGGLSASFLNNNRNKRSVAVDLKQAEGLAVVKRLIATADVLVQNFRPGVIDRMGLGEADVRLIRPDIVYVSISGFGEKGPYAAKPVYDPLVQALSGLATVQGGADTARPRLVRTILPDKLTGYAAAQGITAALFARERTGQGEHLRLSMLQTVIDFLWHSDMAGQTFVGDEMDQQRAASFIDLIYQTTDGYISVAVQTDREWQALTRALERPDWLDDPRFATPALRQDHINERLELTQSVLRERSSREWLARLEAEDVPCAPVLTRSEVIRHEQIGANDMLVEHDHPLAGRIRQTRPAAVFSRHDDWPLAGAPALGADTRAVLEEAGYPASDIQLLLDAGVLAEPARC